METSGYWKQRAKAAEEERDQWMEHYDILAGILEFDCTEHPAMEEAAIKWSIEFGKHRPDPVAILECAEDIARRALAAARA